MSLAIQKLPSGRHIVALIGDPGPVPGEEDEPRPLGGAALRLATKAFWSEQVALLSRRADEASTLEELEAVALALIIAIDHWRAKCQEHQA